MIEKVNENPAFLKKISIEELKNLAKEIREFIIDVVSKNGGHLSSNLGIVELTLSIHRVFNIPPDKVIWDVGHQCYTHKILTGRYKNFSSLRKLGGISGFPEPQENKTDIFHTGHAGTAISSSTGLRIGQEILKTEGKVIAVIGDGSLTNGVTFEGLNFLGSRKKNLLVILNDNRMSISPTKGALSYYLTRLITSPVINKPREEFVEIIKKIPTVGEEILKIAKEIEKKTKLLIIPGVFFEKLGLRYFGPIDGHDILHLIEILENIKEIKEPVLLHVITKKGKGYKFAEENPERFHSASPFNIETGKFREKERISTSDFVGNLLCEMAEKEDFVVITAAMEKGLGLKNFTEKYPERIFDVGIAESHGIVFASGLAKAGVKVIVGIYSTFLQRGFDQIFHDICLQNLPVIFLVDRAGLVGEDGPTHHGVFDISFLRIFPNIKIFAPYSLENLKEVIENSLKENSPVFIRYPKDALPEKIEKEITSNSKIVIVGIGSMAENSLRAVDILKNEGIEVSFFAMDRIKPVDENLIEKIKNFEYIITVEENVKTGGFGSSIIETFAERKLERKFLLLGIPDRFIEHGKRDILLEKVYLTPEKISEKIREFLND